MSVPRNIVMDLNNVMKFQELAQSIEPDYCNGHCLEIENNVGEWKGMRMRDEWDSICVFRGKLIFSFLGADARVIGLALMVALSRRG